MSSVILRPIPESSRYPWWETVNPWLYVLMGLKGGGINLVGHDGTRSGGTGGGSTGLTGRYALEIQSATVNHLAVLLSGTTAGAVPSSANSAILVNDSGVTVGPAFNVSGDILATGNLKWKSGTANTVTLDHAASADHVITVPDATDTLALLALAQTFTGQNTFNNGTAPIIAAKLGPSSTQQHTLPVVTSDTLALLAATQAFTNKAVSLQNGLVGTPSLSFTGQAADGLYWISAGRVGHTLGGTKVLEVVNSGATFGLGIGVAPSTALTVSRSVADYLATLTNANAGGRGLTVVTGGTGGGDALLSLYSNTSTERFSVYADGTINAASGQIQFPATQNPSVGANTLDDYEEGTWTPTNNATTIVSTGYYIKIGRMVTVWGDLTVTTLGAGSTNTISGLPFASDMNAAGVVSVWLNLAANYTAVWVETNSSATCFLRGLTAAAASSGTINALQSTSFIRFTLTYRCAN